jgi:glycosyltransferase involved in cell wall biosynthesis
MSGEESAGMAKEMFKQAISIAGILGTYVVENNIALLIPVNIASNPGNFALTMGVALVSEVLGMYVLNINHDYYWEEGRPSSERKTDEEPGIRDHFFMNSDNKSFFALFQSLYPYDGKKWLQANINQLQSNRLMEQFHFDQEKVCGISTYVGDRFFEKYDRDDVKNARLRMAHILSGGEALLRPLPIRDHLAEIDQWMIDQSPRIIGARPGLLIDPLSDDLIVLLQPTRIIQRKRIGRNLELIAALIQSSELGRNFSEHASRQLLLHITGPVPKEHKADLNQVLRSYDGMLHSLPSELAERIFLSFSVGHQEHTSFAKNQFDPLAVEDIFRMADAVVFPSESEGRGLPIIEAGAIGIPIICSRYRPEKVFAEVVGEHLPEEQQIHYTLFPEGDFSQQLLDEVAELLLHPQTNQIKIARNKKAVQARYSRKSMKQIMATLLDKLIQ